MKMSRSFVLVCFGFFLFSKNINGAEEASGDPIAERLFPPDLVLHNGEAIGLSDEKREEVRSLAMKAQDRFEELEKGMKKEQEAFVAALGEEKLDNAEVLKQLDRVMAQEREVRREQFKLMLSVRGLLTPEQRAKLNDLRKSYKPAAIEARLKDKVALVESGMQDLAGKGVDASPIAEKMQQFPELMRVGKVKEAEALLDRVLKELESK
jgi:uncharacterized membrane protein